MTACIAAYLTPIMPRRERVDIGDGLPVGVADDIAAGDLLGGPGCGEAAGCGFAHAGRGERGIHRRITLPRAAARNNHHPVRHRNLTGAMCKPRKKRLWPGYS